MALETSKDPAVEPNGTQDRSPEAASAGDAGKGKGVQRKAASGVKGAGAPAHRSEPTLFTKAARVLGLLGVVALAFVPLKEVPGQAPTPEGEGAGHSAARVAPDSGAGLSAAGPDGQLVPQSDLIYRIPIKIRPSCVPWDSVVEGELETLLCRDQESGIFYSVFPTVETMDAAFDKWLSVAQPPPPSESSGCAVGEAVVGTWRYARTPTTNEGRMFCYVSPVGNAWIVWSQTSTRILGYAGASAPDIAALHQRWRGWVQVRPGS